MLNVDALLRPRPVLCSWFTDMCLQHAAHLPDHIRFLAVAVVLSCAAELPICILDAVKGILRQCEPPSRDLLSLLHWKCIVSVAGITCLQQPTQHLTGTLTALCEHAADCALAASVSEAISAAAATERTVSSVLRPPSAAVFDWARVLIFQEEDRAQMFAWLLRCSPNDSFGSALHGFITEHGQVGSVSSLSSPLLSLQGTSTIEAHLAPVAVHADITNALRCKHMSLSAVAMSHRTTCTMQQFLEALCECLDAEVQSIQSFDLSPCLPTIFDLLELIHDTSFPECPSVTLPLARTLASRFGSSVDVWMCVHRCMLGPVASGHTEVTAVDVGAVLVPPVPLVHLTHLSGPVDVSVHACWAFACACMQQQHHVDLDLLPSTLICLARTCHASAVAAALLCRAGQWLCMCNALHYEHCSSNPDDESLSRCIDVVMTTLQTLTSVAGTPAMTFLSHVHGAWRSAVSSACENDEAILDCVPPYLLLFSLAAGRVVFANVYGPNVATDVATLIAAALNAAPRLRQLLSGWMGRCGFDSSCSLFAALRDAGVLSSSVSKLPSHDAQDSTSQHTDASENGCPRTPPRADKAVTSPLVYRLAFQQSPSQKSPSTASPLHKSTVSMLDRVLQRFSDDPASLPIDAAKFSLQVKSLDSWKLMIAAVAAPQSCTWAAANLKIRCRFVHALISSSLPGADAALPHLAPWIVGADRRIESDVLHSIVTTWARSNMLLDCHAFCLWALWQVQVSPGVLSSFQSLHKATMILQPMLHAPSMMSAMSAELITRPVTAAAAGRMLALVFASGYSLDSLLEHRSELSFGFFDDSHKTIGGDCAAAALNGDPFGYLCVHGVVGAALVFLHEVDAIASLLRTTNPETRRIMTHRVCFHVLRCISMARPCLDRCNIPMLLSLASTMARDLPSVAELPENVDAADRLLKMCSILPSPDIRHGEEAVQLLRLSRCDLVRTSIANACSSFFSDATATACTHGVMRGAWDASWLASLIATCGHQWDLAGTEKVLLLLRKQLQMGCAPDVGVCASLPDSFMLSAATSLMQLEQKQSSVQHISNIALQLFCRRASLVMGSLSASTSDGLHISASLASLCAMFCEADCVEQLSLLLCMVTCALIQQLQLENMDPIVTVTKFFDEHSSKSCWRGLCLAASCSNLAFAAAAGFSSGAVLLAQLLRVGASFTAALPLLQSAPAYTFAAFSPQFGNDRKILPSIVKIEQHPHEETKFNTEVAMRQPYLPSAACSGTSFGSDFAESCDFDPSAASILSQTKRQLVMHGASDRSPTPACGATNVICHNFDTKCINSTVVMSQLPQKRADPSLSPGAATKSQNLDLSVQKDPASVDTSSSKPVSWLAQLRAHKTSSDHSSDDFILQGVKCDPVHAASPAVLRIASAAAERRKLDKVPGGVGVVSLRLGGQHQVAHNLKVEGDSDDDIVALS